MSVNRVMLVGRVGKEPKYNVAANGMQVLTLSVATSEKWKDKSTGQKRENTEWHQVVLFKQIAEVMHRLLKKGDLVAVEGALKTNKWQDKDGKTHYTTQVISSSFHLLSPAAKDRTDEQPSSHAVDYFSDDSDIPF